MEKSERKVILKVAYIIGIIILLICAFILLTPIIVLYEGVFYPRVHSPNDTTSPDWSTVDGAVACSVLTGWLYLYFHNPQYYFSNLLFAVYLMVILGSMTTAVLFNIFAWRKNDDKKLFNSAVFYLIGLNIISAVLCFIGSAKLKKGR